MCNHLNKFLNLIENFYGVDEEEEGGALTDAVSFAAFIRQHREGKEKDKASAKFSVSVTGPLRLWLFERPGELRLNHSNVNFKYIY